MRIVFFGTPEFGATILEKLVQADLKPVLVVTPPDKKVGRKQELTPTETKVAAQEHGIPLVETESFGNDVVGELESVEPDLFVLASFGKILPKRVLDIPKKGTLNVHPSLLPKFRGPSPVQETILRGEERTGVTIMLMDEKVDHGPILAQEGFSRLPAEFTTQELKAELAELGGKLLAQVIPNWMEGKIKPIVQDHSKATFTRIINKEDGKIDWNKDARYIARQILAFHPWPGTYAFWQGKLLKILKATPIVNEGGRTSFVPGTAVSWQEGFAVVTGKGMLAVEKLQMEGRNTVSAKDFLLGHKDFLGTTLGEPSFG